MARHSYLKFDIAVSDYYGSNNTAIAFARLIYWFSKKPKGFYKFKDACKHPLYKQGDSWSEDLKMTKRILDPIFKRLVTHHKSKNDYRNSTDKFAGKMFCSYTERNTNKTFYFMDKEAVKEFLASIKVSPPLLATPSQPSLMEVVSPSQQPKNMSSPQCREQQDVAPLACAHQTAINTHTITSLPKGEPIRGIGTDREKEKLSSKEMVNAWNSHTQDKVVWYPSTASRLYKVLADFFGGCVEAFKKYCSAIGNTKFLMGKAPNSNFKAFFYWAIKPEVIKSIFQGAYGVENILSKIGNVSEQDKIQYEINTIGYEILNIEKKIECSKQEIIDAQEKMVKEHRQTIGQDVKDGIMKKVQNEVNQKYPLGGYSEKNREILANVQYHADLVNHCRTELKLCNPEDIVVPPELIAKKKHLEEKRAAMCKRLEQILRENLKAQKDIKTFVEKAA